MDFTSWMLLISAWAYITPFDPNHKGPGRAELPLISARLLLCMISISHLIWNCNIRSLTLSLGTWIGSITHCLGIEIGLPIVGPFFHWPFFTMAGIWRPFQTQDTAENQTKGVSGCEWARQLLSARTDDEFITIINQYWDWNHVCCQKNRILILPALESYNISNPEIILLHTRNHKPLQPQTSTNIE